MVTRNTRDSVREDRRSSLRDVANRRPERDDMLPWADPYIASLARAYQVQSGQSAPRGR